MTDSPDEQPDDPHPLVAELAAALAELDRLPVADHVPVLESAHERLRAALADAGGGAEGPTGATPRPGR